MRTITTLRRGDPTYPRRLLALEVGPEQLWTCGGWDGTSPSVAVVGARSASVAAQQAAFALARDLSLAGVTVISGGAIGVDAAAHRGALEGPSPTCVVLGTGVDLDYPIRHRSMFDQVVRRGGCLMSMFPLGTPPKAWHFPARNRVIAALCDVIVVVESALGSGSRYTALAGREQGKPVAVFPDSPGTQELLREGAVQLDPDRGAQDVLRLLREPPRRPEERQQPGRQAELFPLDSMLGVGPAGQVRAALSLSPCDMGELSARTGLPVSDCAAVVIDLELQGICTRLTGGRIAALEQVS